MNSPASSTIQDELNVSAGIVNTFLAGTALGSRDAYDQAATRAASAIYRETAELEIDLHIDEAAQTLREDDDEGCLVQAWIWVSASQIRKHL